MKFLMQFVIVLMLDEVLGLTMCLIRPFLRLSIFWAALRLARDFI